MAGRSVLKEVESKRDRVLDLNFIIDKVDFRLKNMSRLNLGLYAFWGCFSYSWVQVSMSLNK